MDNSFIKEKCKNKDWFDKMYNEKLEQLYIDNKIIGRSILYYITFNDFVNKYKKEINKKYFIVNIPDVSFISFYGKTFKESIFYKFIEDTDINFNNQNYTFKNSILYEELSQNKITSLSKYFNLKKPNNLEKLSKYSEFYPWKDKFTNVPFKFCGPYHSSIINMHFIKFKRALEGIQKYGIKYNAKNMISGYFLKKNSKKKFIVTSGIHRIIILKYLYEIKQLDTNDIICEVNYKTIDFDNINNWYHVKNKFISKINAEKIFNHLFI